MLATIPNHLRISEIAKRIQELRAQIELVQETLKKYEQTILKNRSQRDSKIRECEKTEENIQTLQKRTEAASIKSLLLGGGVSNGLQHPFFHVLDLILSFFIYASSSKRTMSRCSSLQKAFCSFSS